MRRLLLLISISLLCALSSCHRHNPYKGLSKYDRKKMKMVHKFNEKVAEDNACPAKKAYMNPYEQDQAAMDKRAKKAKKKKWHWFRRT